MLKDMFVAGAEQRETPLREKIEATVRAYLASYEAGDIEGRLQLFAPDASFEDPVGTPAMVGHAALREFFAQVGGLPTKGKLRHLSVNGHEAAMLFDITIFGEGYDKATVTVAETMVMDDEGRFKSLRAFWDRNSIS
jgi:steroid delta-isomerase